MESGGSRRGTDWLAVTAAVLTVAMAVVYGLALHDQGDRPVNALTVVLVVAAVLSCHGARHSRVHRRPALIVAAVVLALVGLAGLLTIGLPLLVAAGLCTAAAVRAPLPARSGTTPGDTAN